MNKRLLVAYATKSGTTIDVALTIGQALDNGTTIVDVHSVDRVDNVEKYDAAVIGSGVRMGQWLPPAIRFVKQHQDALRQIPVAFFTVCITMVEDTPENRREVEGYTSPVCELVEPVSMGLFAGKIDPSHLSLWERFIVRLVGAPQGDFRDWLTIRQWAQDVRPLLLNNK